MTKYLIEVADVTEGTIVDALRNWGGIGLKSIKEMKEDNAVYACRIDGCKQGSRSPIDWFKHIEIIHPEYFSPGFLALIKNIIKHQEALR